MPGEIKHTWVGTTLIVQSDSGTSGANLKGDRGDIGPRGPQGPAGVVYDADGNIIMEGYATEQYVQDMLREVDVDLTGYATEEYVDEQIAQIPQPDLTPYATKEHVAEEIGKIPEVDLSNYPTREEVTKEIADAEPNFEGIATEEYVDQKIAEIPQTDLTPYATKEYVDEQIDAIPEVDLTGYATEIYVDNEIKSIPLPNLDNYATKDYVDVTTTVALSNHYTKDEIDETIANLAPGTGGGGGSSSGNNAILTLQNNSGWLYKIIAVNGECPVSATWSSTEDGLTTGNGIATITVNGIVKALVDVAQGKFTINIAPYLTVGSNSVRLTVSDVYQNSRSIIYSVEVVSATISSTFDATIAYTGEITFPYVASGNIEKSVYFYLDGNKIGTHHITTSGRQGTFTIPAQKHGAHKFEVYFSSTISGMTVESNRLIYDLICTEEGKTNPIIASAFSKGSMTQFETVQIYYSVYTPGALTTDIELIVNGKVIKNLTVDRTQQLWSFRADESGLTVLKIRSGTSVKTITIGVDKAAMDVEAETSSLALYLSSYGRSNSENNRDSWTYNDIECQFENYNWTSDGWVADDNGMIVHRISGDARLTIPVKIFENDARSTGKTIEIEFATRDILNYDSVIASCMSDGIGFEMTAQKASIKSEQSAITTQYKENEHIRLTFVIEKRAENRLVYTYLNGVMCGAVQYVDNDNFAQSNPVDFTLGSNDAILDIYTIRVYENSLTRHQVLDNWIADTQDINERYNRYIRNNIYDAYGNIIISNLPNTLPYLILEAPALPDFKGNELTVKASYVDPVNEEKSFVFEEAKADVQGTSSAGYVRKNYIIEYPENYQLRANSIPTNIFTYKADVASSEGANNVELVRLYNEISPYRTPPQAANANVRQGIDGFPIVIFHNDGHDTKFIGKYNFNNDKKTPEVFGFYEGDESWEIKNNTSNRVLFKNADFSGTDWMNDFEGRYPDKNTDPTTLAEFAAWVASTDTTGVSETEKAARLAKFKAELADHAEVQSALFYYLFTELFLMVDSRAKNAFPTFYNGGKVCWLPYDMDTAMGINNEGALTFGYELEDTDLTPEGKLVYNGQESVFWNNLRDTFGEELKAMYQKLRSDGVLTYDIVEQMFEDHQSVWPEAIWNEDAWFKYLQPLVELGNASYLSMLQGSKEEQRKWWLYNRFRYLDSKYNAGDAEKDFITLRGYAKDNITVEPYADIYASIKYGSYLVQERALRGNSYTLDCPVDTLNDTEIYIYSASQLKSIGDVSGLKVGYADFASATKLQNLKLGDASSSYTNSNLEELYLGNNTLLKTLDVRNCPKLGSGEKQQAVDLSGCTNIENIYFDGTTIKGCTLPNGGSLKVLHLPSTITNLTIRNQKALTELVIPSYENVSTLRLENIGDKVDTKAILRQIKAGSRVRLIGIDWTFAQASDVAAIFDILDTMKGLDENDNNMAKAQISGNIHVPAMTSTELDSLKSRYSTVTFTYDSLAYTVNYYNYDGSLLYTYSAAEGSTAIDPVATGKISTPTKPGVPGTDYYFTGWSSLPVINATTSITAQFSSQVAVLTVSFYNGGQLVATREVQYGSCVDCPRAIDVTAPTGKIFAGWYPQPRYVTANMTCSALFASDSLAHEPITDSWDMIFANIANGTYASKYHRNMYKDVTLGDDEKFTMHIAGMGVDPMLDGVPAAISWISDEDWNDRTPDKWHENLTSAGTLRWSECSLRASLQQAMNLLPTNVRSRIVPVKKTQNAYSSFSMSTEHWESSYDNIWITSTSELFNGQVREGNRIISNDYFVPTEGMTQGNYVYYWTRDKWGKNMAPDENSTIAYEYTATYKGGTKHAVNTQTNYGAYEHFGFCTN